MRACVFGLGYVGTVAAACLVREGHSVVGVDVDPMKVELINSGKSPILEEGLDVLVREMVAAGRLSATLDAVAAAASAEVSIVCAGTPTDHEGKIDLSHVRGCCEQIGRSMAGRSDFPVVLIRSTVPPGTTRRDLIPILERTSGLKEGDEFGACFMPEFLREGSALSDYGNPMKKVVGADDERTARVVSALYSELPGAPVITSLEVAETVKYVDNAWHALKVGFANEVGTLCKRLNVDSHDVMDVFCRDTRLNISSAYLTPGYAFGGSCLPKDLRALTREGRMHSLDLPILNSVLPSNSHHIARTLHLVEAMERRRIGVLGISYKPGTDDLRESPVVELVERLIGKGYEIALYDPNVHLARLTGSNRQQILERIPHIAKLLLDTVEQVVERSELIVIGNREPEFDQVLRNLREDQVVLDLVRISRTPETRARYVGICW